MIKIYQEAIWPMADGTWGHRREAGARLLGRTKDDMYIWLIKSLFKQLPLSLFRGVAAKAFEILKL